MRRIDDQKDEAYLNVCVYGRPGTGKTTIGVTAPKPLILLSERQGMVHIRKAAKRLGVPVPPVMFMESLEDYRNVLRGLHGPKDQPLRIHESVRGDDGEITRSLVQEFKEWPETVVIDSLTDGCRLVVEEIRRASPPKKGRDGLPTDGQRFWQVLGDRTKQLILGFRDASVHTLFLCLLDDRETGEGEDKARTVGPNMAMRKMPDDIAAAVNFIGVSYRTQRRVPGEKDARQEYGVMTAGPEYMLLKPYRPLRDFELPDFSHWVRVVFGELEWNSVAAPAPSRESPQGAVAAEDEALPTSSAGVAVGLVVSSDMVDDLSLGAQVDAEAKPSGAPTKAEAKGKNDKKPRGKRSSAKKEASANA